jgi:hypothetical protein
VQPDADEQPVAEGHVDERVDCLLVGRIVPGKAVGRGGAAATIADGHITIVTPADATQDFFAGDGRGLAPSTAVGGSGDKRARIADRARVAPQA